MTKHYYIIEAENGYIDTIKMICDESKKLKFLGEVTGINFEIKELELPIKLINYGTRDTHR